MVPSNRRVSLYYAPLQYIAPLMECHDERVISLHIVYVYRLKVTFGSSRRLLHHISPFQFVDSPEWYTTQYAFPTDVKASKPQVRVLTSIILTTTQKY